MSVVDPLRFIISLIVICGLLQVFGIIDGPCNPPPGTFDYSISNEEWEPMYEEWKVNR